MMECNRSIISREHREPSLHSRDWPALEVIDQFTTFAASRPSYFPSERLLKPWCQWAGGFSPRAPVFSWRSDL